MAARKGGGGGGGEAGEVKGWLRSEEIIRGREFHFQTGVTCLYTSASYIGRTTELIRRAILTHYVIFPLIIWEDKIATSFSHFFQIFISFFGQYKYLFLWCRKSIFVSETLN